MTTQSKYLHIRAPKGAGRVSWHIPTLCGHYCGPMSLTGTDTATCPKCAALHLLAPAKGVPNV